MIATRNRPDLLDRCLGALDEQSVRPSAVIVVDNSAGDEATRVVARARNASYLVEPRRGVSYARNLGAREATSDVVAFVDDDAVPAGGWLASLLLEFRDARVAAVTGRIRELAECGCVSDSRRVHASEPVVFGGPTRIAFDRTTVDWFERANFGGIGQGANLAIRRSVFASWAGFDKRLGAGTAIGGAEEHHAFFCLIDRGHRVVYAPAATVYHPSPATDAEARTLRLRQLRTASAHLALLLAEERRYRRPTAGYALRAIAGRPPMWRTETSEPQLSRLDVARARVGGIGAYVWVRLASGTDRES